MRTGRLTLIAATLVLGTARAALAEPTQEEQAMASALFEEGRALMASERYDAACERLAESHRLDPAGGTLLNLAECRRLQGKTATAHSLYGDALALARRDRRDDRVDVCKRAIAELAPRLAMVRIIVPEASKVDGLVVRINGVVVPEIARGSDLPVDPGSVSIDAEADGRIPRRWKVDVVDGGRSELVIEPLASIAKSTPANAPPIPEDTEALRPPRVEDVAGRPLATLRLDVDGRGRGAILYAGIGYGIASFLEVGAGALLGASNGVEPGARLFVPLGIVRPHVTVAAPIFFRDRPFAGLRAGGGIELSVHRHVAIAAQLSGVWFPEPSSAFEGGALVPALALVGRL